MKKMNVSFSLVFIFILLFFLFSCGNTANLTTPNEPAIVPPPIPGQPLDPAFWFKEIFDELRSRVGEVFSDSYTGPAGNQTGQIANCQYVIDEINAAKGTSLTVETPNQAADAADCEYLLKMIDRANDGNTSYGTGVYATRQVVDTAAVNAALQKIIPFLPESWSTPGEYSCDLPPGTYKMTAVSGRGGNGGDGGSGGKGGTGASGMKATQIFTITTTTTITVIVAGNGLNGSSVKAATNAGGGKGGDISGGCNGGNCSSSNGSRIVGGGGGGGGASGISSYYYISGGGGGGGSAPALNGGNANGSTGGSGGGIYGGRGGSAGNNGGHGGGNSGGGGGGGGILSGTALSGIATMEYPYVSIELN